jgi:K+-transporting ATPase c subunit
MTAFIYSTLSTDMEYAHWENRAGQPVKVKSVKILGGANICKEGDSGKFFTPRGVVTKVNDEDLDLLQKNEVFNLHQKNGFISVEKSEKKVDKAIENMASTDFSAPKTEKTLPSKKREKEAA